MRLSTNSFDDGDPIPARYAFAKPDPDSRVTLSENVNPHLEWSDIPEGTKSFALIAHDPDVPSRGDDVNQPDREVPEDLSRVDFFHWVLVDIPANKRSIAEGEFCDGVVPGGQDAQEGPHGTRQGLNDFTGWFSGDEDMEGKYYGYDGCAPPWNDSIPHRYVFTVYALDVEKVNVDGDFTGHDVREAIEGHVLAEASITGTYTQNPRLTD
ncbi:MAG TPA: YbhB/YbcL family Raf kinase inhibitor-like protein [Acidimicrobiia bacterium]|nr:YbhB/YbcL family Raf kinase inhibitor-like protein [Acidimicrobiia bacterium]